MGLVEDIDALELSDDQKQALKESATSVVEENLTLKARNNKSDVDKEIENLKQLGFAEAPGALAFVRRVFLSDDKEIGIVLLSDDDLMLSDEDKLDANSREEMTSANVLREFIKRLPLTNEGKLKFELSDQGLNTGNEEKPGSGDPDDPDKKADIARANLSRATGRTITKRTNKRYGGNVVVGNEGGDS